MTVEPKSDTCETCGGTGEYIRPELFENDPLAMGLMAQAMQDGTGQCEKDPCPDCKKHGPLNPRNTIPFEMSGGDTIPDDVLLECPDFDIEAEGSDGCAQGGECPFAGNENACSDGAE